MRWPPLAECPVSTHLFTETAPHLMAAIPSAGAVECFPGWFDHLFGPVRPREGSIAPAAGAGIGVQLLAQTAGEALRTVELGPGGDRPA